MRPWGRLAEVYECADRPGGPWEISRGQIRRGGCGPRNWVAWDLRAPDGALGLRRPAGAGMVAGRGIPVAALRWPPANVHGPFGTRYWPGNYNYRKALGSRRLLLIGSSERQVGVGHNY